MKLKRILTTTFLASILTLGVGLFVANNNKAEVKPAEAAGTSATIYVEPFDAGSDKGGKWSNFKYYLFGSGGNNGWPGVSFDDSMKTKTPNEYGTYHYALTVDTDKYQKLVLTGNSDSTWGGSFAKTVDIIISDVNGKGVYCGAHQGWQTDANVFKINSYTYSYNTVYLYDIRGNVFNTTHNCHAWKPDQGATTWPGASMDKVSGTNNIYSIDINGALNYILFNNGSGQTADISGFSNGDVYIVYPDFGFNLSTLEASEFIDKYMKFETKWTDDEGDGSCKTAGWYSSAKSAFNGKSTAVKTKILENEPTQYRLANWAKANGDTLDVSAKTLSSSRITPLFSTTGSNSSMMAIVIVSVLSITALGGYFFFRKSKHEND